MNTLNIDAGVSRKEMLKKWRAQKGVGAAPNSNSDKQTEPSSGDKSSSKQNGHNGVLVARPGAANGVKRPASRANKGAVKRKPFKVDAVAVREASELRVAPGTPLHMLKKRLKRMAANAGPDALPANKHTAVGGQAAKGKGKTTASRGRISNSDGNRDGVGRSLDAARMKQVSDYLKSQISEANMLLEIAGVDAARTLLADLLSCAGDGRGVGELALYWAARAKLEEDAGIYTAARRTLDEGQAYISMPTQRKVMEKVVAAFEDRMNDRAEADVAQLLDESAERSNSSSTGHSNSPTSCTPFRYDPNDLSVEEDESGSNVGSAIKNLNFSRIACADNSAQSSSRESKGFPSAGAAGDEQQCAGGGASSANINIERSGGSDVLSGVVYSDDDSDLSISDIDEAVLARAKAFTDEERVRSERLAKAKGMSVEHAPVSAESDLTSRPRDHDMTMPPETVERSAMKADPSRLTDGIAATMLPPESRPSRRRKGTPHPKRSTSEGADGKGSGDDRSPGGSFIAQVEAKGKDGKRTLTPVRRSRRLSATKEPTPSPLRKEMEAML